MKELLLGNEAFAKGAIDADVRVVSSYPGTPSTEITECIAKHKNIYSEWAPNEKVALEVALGAAIGGARALCCMKHVGLNVAADPLFTSAYTGINSGLVILVADDPGMHSSQNEQDSRFYARSAHIPMLEPSDSQEAYDYMRDAFEISERYDIPVLIRSTTRISHSRSLVKIRDAVNIELKPYKKDISKYVMMPAMAKKRHIELEKKMNNISEFAESYHINNIEYNNKNIGIITSGIAYNYVKESLPNASVLKLGMIFPLPLKLIKKFSENVEKLYVIEELEPFLEEQINAAGIEVHGKALFSNQGEYTARNISKVFNGEEIKTNEHFDGPQRPPVLCPGCPHRAVFYMINKLGITAIGDIGCYTLGAVSPLNALDTTICMGASLGMAHGMTKALGNSHKIVSVIGDSTFFHSGIPGLINMIYNNTTSTVLILDNSTTGMTGHQDHPSTGKNAKGEEAPVINIANLVRSIGINNVIEVNPLNLKELKNVLENETEKDELSVIIVKYPCRLLKNTQDNKKDLIITNCKNCKSCLKLGCPALIQNGSKVEINKTICTNCELCMQVCPFGLIKENNTL